MSSGDLTEFFTDTVTVRTYLGTAGNGSKSYAALVAVPCSLSRRQRFVRNANGEQVASGASLSADIDWADTLTVESIVSIPGEPDTTVISRAVSTGGGLIDDIDSVKVYLQ